MPAGIFIRIAVSTMLRNQETPDVTSNEHPLDSILGNIEVRAPNHTEHWCAQAYF